MTLQNYCANFRDTTLQRVLKSPDFCLNSPHVSPSSAVAGFAWSLAVLTSRPDAGESGPASTARGLQGASAPDKLLSSAAIKESRQALLPPGAASCRSRACSPGSDSSPRSQDKKEITICWGYLSEADTQQWRNIG